MKIKIEYDYDPGSSINFPFWAKSTLKDRTIFTSGMSWEDARNQHLDKLKKIAPSGKIPVSEEVEI